MQDRGWSAVHGRAGQGSGGAGHQRAVQCSGRVWRLWRDRQSASGRVAAVWVTLVLSDALHCKEESQTIGEVEDAVRASCIGVWVKLMHSPSLPATQPNQNFSQLQYCWKSAVAFQNKAAFKSF